MKTIEELKSCFDKIIEQCKQVPEDLDVFCETFDNALDDLLNEDFFGTEGQCDPRGDRRERQ
jgi:hypothetical protein